MRRVRIGVALTTLIVLVVPGVLGGPSSGIASDRDNAPAGAEPSDLSRLMVSGHEYSLALSRARVRRGTALIQFVNRGEDSHDLVLRRTSGGSTIQFAEIGPGRIAQTRAHLSAGRYRLWCSLSDHARRGMRATLRVRR